MKTTTKFNLDFGTVEARLETKKKALETGKSMNQYILDCVEINQPWNGKIIGDVYVNGEKREPKTIRPKGKSDYTEDVVLPKSIDIKPKTVKEMTGEKIYRRGWEDCLVHMEKCRPKNKIVNNK